MGAGWDLTAAPSRVGPEWGDTIAKNSRRRRKIMRIPLPTAAALGVVFGGALILATRPVSAQTTSNPVRITAKHPEESMSEKLNRLESEIVALKAQVAALST